MGLLGASYQWLVSYRCRCWGSLARSAAHRARRRRLEDLCVPFSGALSCALLQALSRLPPTDKQARH